MIVPASVVGVVVTVTGADGQDQTLTYPSYPYAIEGEERSVVMGVEIAF